MVIAQGSGGFTPDGVGNVVTDTRSGKAYGYTYNSDGRSSALSVGGDSADGVALLGNAEKIRSSIQPLALQARSVAREVSGSAASISGSTPCG